MQRFVTFVTFLKTGCSIPERRPFVKLFETIFSRKVDINLEIQRQNAEKTVSSTKSSYKIGYKSYSKIFKKSRPGKGGRRRNRRTFFSLKKENSCRKAFALLVFALL